MQATATNETIYYLLETIHESYDIFTFSPAYYASDM